MKIVYIEWRDASETDRYHKDVAIPKDQCLGLQTVYSVGIVAEDTEEYISLAGSLSDSGWYVGIQNIPKVGIKSMNILSDEEENIEQKTD